MAMFFLLGSHMSFTGCVWEPGLSSVIAGIIQRCGAMYRKPAMFKSVAEVVVVVVVVRTPFWLTWSVAKSTSFNSEVKSRDA